MEDNLEDLFKTIDITFKDKLNSYLKLIISNNKDLNHIQIIKHQNGDFFNILIDYKIEINNIRKEVQWNYIEDYYSDSNKSEYLYLENIDIHEIWYDIIDEPKFFFILDKLQDKLNENFKNLENILVEGE